MKQPKNLTNTKPRWMLWILLLVCIVVLVCVGYLTYLYQSIQKEKHAQFDKSEKDIINETQLTEIDEMHLFHEENTYQIAFGKTANDEKKIIFLSDAKEFDEILIDQSDTISKERMIKQVKSQCNNCKIKKVSPAMIDDHPLWEVTYRDESNRYIFDYFSLYDGTRYEQLRFKQMFK